MTIAIFVDTYSKDTLLGEALGVGTTSLRNYLKEHKLELENEKLVKYIKKINSIGINIVDPEGLYKKLT